MIQAAINHIATQLNAYLRRNNNLNEDIVVVSGLSEFDGSIGSHIDNKLVLLITNIQKDTLPQRSPSYNHSPDGRILLNSPALYLNLYVMLAANFSGNNYLEALKFISKAIVFFQLQPVFDQLTSPDLDPRIEKLVMDIENLNIQELSNLWSLLGGKYLPSVYYRIRMININPDNVVAQTPLLTQPQIDVLP